MTRVVVTGASGFIGRSLVERLVRDGWDGAAAQVVAISRHAHDAFGGRAGVAAHAIDLTTTPLDTITKACGRGAVVFHLAADASVTAGTRAAAANVLGTERLIAALQDAAPRRVVYVSSIGAVDRTRLDRCTRLLDEHSQPSPLTAYGRSKLEGERRIAASGLPFSIVRPTWVYGPSMRANSHIRVFVDMVRRDKFATKLRFPGRVSVIHVSDLCDALILVAGAPGSAGETYFASDGQPRSIGEIFDVIGDNTGGSAAKWGIPWPLPALARVVRPLLPLALQNLHSDVLAASNDKLEAIGFRPRIAFADGVRELTRSLASASPAWLVTGAASGIGRELTKQLMGSGARVVAVDRSADALQPLAAEGTVTEVADLATESGRVRVAALVRETSDLVGVINCAGIGARGRSGDLAADVERRVVDVNATAVVTVTGAALSRFRREGVRGTVVNVASSAALQPLALMATYAASKAFVLSYTEAVAQEARGDVCVIAACPGGTATNFQAAAGVKQSPGERLMSPATVARRILRAARKGKSGTLFIGSRTWAMSLVARGLSRKRVARLWARMMEKLR